jgi:hypothetical protein
MDRRLRGLAQVEQRELQSLETARVKEQRVKTRARSGGNRMPALTLVLKPRGRRDVATKAKTRHTARAALEEVTRATPEAPKRSLALREEFARAAGDDGAGGSGNGSGGSSDSGKPTDPTRPKGPRRRQRRDRARDGDHER